jgi:hypothetical protein
MLAPAHELEHRHEVLDVQLRVGVQEKNEFGRSAGRTLVARTRKPPVGAISNDTDARVLCGQCGFRSITRGVVDHEDVDTDSANSALKKRCNALL